VPAAEPVRARQRGDHRGGGIAHVQKVTPYRPVVPHGQRLPGEGLPGSGGHQAARRTARAGAAQ
jgi:hypothetical protein